MCLALTIAGTNRFFNRAEMTNSELISKYDVAAPRYTSYPTVPYWNSGKPTEESWRNAVLQAASGDDPLSVYIHLLFCESLCTYCACNTRITTNHSVEAPYIRRVLEEWAMYTEMLPGVPKIGELHLGGGTPTFFSPQNLRKLMEGIRAKSLILPEAALSFEAHPNSTTEAHLVALGEHGFRRLSLGVQDFDPVVQKLIHREQSAEQVQHVTDVARRLGYTSVNFDLIYGLPSQTLPSIKKTINEVINMRPDRIAFYSYAHVPWMRPGQRSYTDADLPGGESKRALYEQGREQLQSAGYIEIGLDHFALPGDELLRAAEKKTLHRNFMGYTEKQSSLLIGLGVSAISDAGTMFVQNAKTLEEWNTLIDDHQLPFFRGHELSQEDLVLRKHILNVMCKGETDWSADINSCPALRDVRSRLLDVEQDGLIELSEYGLRATESGKPFLRNIGMCFDARYHSKKPETQIFSRSA